eukprot:721214-Amphidinium_carterae.1
MAWTSTFRQPGYGSPRVLPPAPPRIAKLSSFFKLSRGNQASATKILEQTFSTRRAAYFEQREQLMPARKTMHGAPIAPLFSPPNDFFGLTTRRHLLDRSHVLSTKTVPMPTNTPDSQNRH